MTLMDRLSRAARMQTNAEQEQRQVIDSLLRESDLAAFDMNGKLTMSDEQQEALRSLVEGLQEILDEVDQDAARKTSLDPVPPDKE
jgi:hypothetical protein